MSDLHNPNILQEVERIAAQTQQVLPCWEELLERAHAVCEGIEQRISEAAAEADSTQPADSGAA